MRRCFFDAHDFQKSGKITVVETGLKLIKLEMTR